jgi:hypothetical protein
MSTPLPFTSHPVHQPRFLTVVLLGVLVCTFALSWLPGTSAQPMCPIDQIWSDDEETCVDLDPTAEPSVTPEPTATSEQEAPEPTIPMDEPPTSGADDQNVPTTEAGVGTPGAETSDQFILGDWWDDLFGFEGRSATGWMALYSCNRPVNAGDTFDSLMPDCRQFTETSAALGFNIYVNGQFQETLGAGNDLYLGGTLPVGEISIQAFYPDDFQAPWVDCHVYRMDDDTPVTTYLYPWKAQGRAMLTLPLDVPDSHIACVWFFPPNDVMAVDAYAYTCPAYVTDQTIQYNDLLSRCSASSESEMQIVSEDGVENRIADMGWAPFRNVPLGTVAIRGFPPEGYGNPLVYCMVLGGGGQTTKGLDLEIIDNQGYVTIKDTLPGGIIRCDFFYRES